MMKFNFRDLEVPPDGYRATMPDGTLIRATDRGSWFTKIKQHYEWNSIPLPDDWQMFYEDQLCKLLPPSWCRWSDGSNVMDHIETRLSIGDLFRGLDVLKSLVTEPDPYVTKEQATERAAICIACPAHITIPGCLPCIGFSNIVSTISGGRTTPHDHMLKQCAICRCSVGAMAHIKAEVLVKGTTPEQMGKYALLPHCWKKREIDALNQ